MTREEQMVVLARDETGKPTVWCDPEIADLVKALNDGGLRTVASCSGHGEKDGIISLADGRTLTVMTKETSAPDHPVSKDQITAGQKLYFVLDADKYVSAPALEGLRAFLREVKHGGMADIKTRVDGREKWFQADWAKYLKEERR